AFAYSTCPVSRSASSADGADSFGCRVEGRGVTSLVGNGEAEPNGGTGVGGGVGAAAAHTAAAIRQTIGRAQPRIDPRPVRTVPASARHEVIAEVRTVKGLLQLARQGGQIRAALGCSPSCHTFPIPESR